MSALCKTAKPHSGAFPTYAETGLPCGIHEPMAHLTGSGWYRHRSHPVGLVSRSIDASKTEVPE